MPIIYQLTADSVLMRNEDGDGRDIGRLAFTRNRDGNVFEDIEDVVASDPETAADWFVEDLNAIAYNAPIWTSDYQELTHAVSGLGRGDDDLDKGFTELVCEIRNANRTSYTVLNLSLLADQGSPPLYVRRDTEGRGKAPGTFGGALHRILCLLPHLDEEPLIREEFRALLREHDGHMATANFLVPDSTVDAVEAARLEELLGADSDAYFASLDDLEPVPTVNLAQWIRAADSRELVLLALDHDDAVRVETRIAEFYTQPGRVYENREDMKAENFEIIYSHGELLRRIFETRPDPLREHIAGLSTEDLWDQTPGHVYPTLVELGLADPRRRG